jgi:hypothetical protein
LIAIFFTPPLMATDEGNSADKSARHKTISLAEVEPTIYHSFQRYSKFYGDGNTGEKP